MEAIGQLTGGIAHDFNNMLQGVMGALELARRRLEEGRTNDTTRLMVAANDAAGQAAGLTQRLLAFARRQQLDPRPVDADALVRGVSDLLRRTVGPAITLNLHLCGDGWAVLCDPSELEGTVLNLCINARDAMPDGGDLTITTREALVTADDLQANEDVHQGVMSRSASRIPVSVCRRRCWITCWSRSLRRSLRVRAQGLG
jgi:signal transduction histidine kinase